MSAKAAATPGKILAFGHHALASDMTVVEFLAGMTLARQGALTSTAIAREVSNWLGKELRVAELRPALLGLVQHQWASAEAGSYTLSEDGIEALRGPYVALVRMLDGGRRLLDVAVFLSLIKDFERSGS